jgi:thioesterase domain-containing protein/acyl carrier protein
MDRNSPQDDVESTLTGIFEDLLKVSPVGVDESFFDLGGHSFLAVQLVARIRKELGVTLPLSALFEEDEVDGVTVSALGRLVRGPHQHESRCVVPLHRNSAAAPLYLVHPAGGDLLGYRRLAVHLGHHWSVHGLRPPPLSHPDADQDIARLATDYLDHVRAQRPEGPHFLVGWSTGGLIAFEMADRLRRAGAEVGLLAVVDSYFGDQLPEYDEAAVLLDFAAELAHKLGDTPAVPEAELRALLHDRAPRELLERVLPPDLDANRILEHLHLYRAHVRAAKVYEPPAGAQRLLLVQAADVDTAVRERAVRAWQSRVEEPLDHHVIGGDHFDLLREPHVQALADILTASSPERR